MADRPMTTMSTTDVIELLLADHEEAKALLGRFDHTEPSERAAYFYEVVNALVRHEVAEERVVYPIIRHDVPDGEKDAKARIAEQSEVEKLLVGLEKLDASSEEFAAEFATLRGKVLEHAGAEEATTFPLLEQMEDAESRLALGGLYELAKAKAPSHPHPHAPQTPPGDVIFGVVASLFDKARDAVRSA
jgi:hemerythrin superfamily protein